MVKIIETVYNFLWGDLLTLPLPGRRNSLPFSFSHFTNSYRILFHDPDKISTNTSFFKDMVGASF